ncbi:phage protein [Vibrio europaeus]|uniref:Phage protein n=1 Tax=Vibrio europaeus TaxID=300876 RepID=A0A178J5N7_9VIBR|nr:phage protein [Vibrio europaeus]MDC5706659.1 phage protein [Vibrio europaeus]MDC5711808.1 phage protein [Vibrio europaeus]MDC5716499.1 phage protein [Vibrio europaeus]MDC5725798.1 phage protein [Vibrio europaeus]MDC5732787.1 phage protein [Vibrio europaeus]
MKYHEMTKNYIFREFECGLSIEKTANLCFKSVKTIKSWDQGKTIPPECKRLMRMATGRELSICEEWQGFKMHIQRVELPTGQFVSAQEILSGIALLEIQSDLEIKTNTKLLKLARAIAKIKGRTEA